MDELEQVYASGRLIICTGPAISVEGGLATPVELVRQLLTARHDDRAVGIRPVRPSHSHGRRSRRRVLHA
jgi:hypothetical protein